MRNLYLDGVLSCVKGQWHYQSGIFSIETSKGDHLITSIGDW